MRNKLLASLILCLAFVSLSVTYSWSQQRKQSKADTFQPVVSFNEKFIEGLYSELDVDDPVAVFKVVFFALDDKVIVYQTGGHYYFTVNTNGKTIFGNLMVKVNETDQITFLIAYFFYDENGIYLDRVGIVKEFFYEDGVLVERLEPLVYSVSYLGKTVIFRFNDIGTESPETERLTKNEVLVTSVFDESALKFFLLFNNKAKHLMYILNENGLVPEEFLIINEDVVLGRRTGYLFYQDKKYNRKILIAVHTNSTSKNNWYDGPFDQVPGNQPEYAKIVKYVLEAYPFTREYLEESGGPTPQKGYGVSIMPYSYYYSFNQIIEHVESCKSANMTEDQFYNCITPDFRQR